MKPVPENCTFGKLNEKHQAIVRMWIALRLPVEVVSAKSSNWWDLDYARDWMCEPIFGLRYRLKQ